MSYVQETTYGHQGKSYVIQRLLPRQSPNTQNDGVPIPMLAGMTSSTFAYKFYIPPQNRLEHLLV